MRAEFSITLSARSAAVRIALLYFAGSAAWVDLSDSILHGVIRGAPPVLWQLETVKGLIFSLYPRVLWAQPYIVASGSRKKHAWSRNRSSGSCVSLELIGIFGYDETGTVKQANDAFLRIIGYTKEELCKDEIVLAQLTPVEYVHRNAVAAPGKLPRVGSHPFTSRSCCERTALAFPLSEDVPRQIPKETTGSVTCSISPD